MRTHGSHDAIDAFLDDTAWLAAGDESTTDGASEARDPKPATPAERPAALFFASGRVFG